MYRAFEMDWIGWLLAVEADALSITLSKLGRFRIQL